MSHHVAEAAASAAANFKAEEYVEAAQAYNEAINLSDDRDILATLFSNRAACRLRLR